MFTIDNTECSTKISIISQNKFDGWFAKQPLFIKNWCISNNFKGENSKIIKIPYSDGRLKEVIIGEGTNRDLSGLSQFASLCEGNYYIYSKYALSSDIDIQKAWSWGNYKFQMDSKKNSLYVKSEDDLNFLNLYENVINFSRNLINSPANEINPISFQKKIKNCDLFSKFIFNNYTISDIKFNFPLTYAVGKSSNSQPQVIHLSNKKITKKDKPLVIIGKGVTFDTGGINIKPGNSMRNMKKDMGGSAIAISLFLLADYLLKKTKIVLIIPLAENSISSSAMRPGDIYSSKSGKKVEVSHTDAEGRLLLADAIELACKYNPMLILDFATLTGAARVALGEDLPAYFCNEEDIANKIEKLNKKNMRCWRMPLFSKYKKKLHSDIANISNASLDGMAGAITAALFLQEFLKPENTPWIHIDTFAWSNGSYLSTKGAALQGLDIMIEFLQNNYS